MAHSPLCIKCGCPIDVRCINKHCAEHYTFHKDDDISVGEAEILSRLFGCSVESIANLRLSRELKNLIFKNVDLMTLADIRKIGHNLKEMKNIQVKGS